MRSDEELSDEELIAEYQRSRADEAADALVGRHLGAIRGFVFQMVLNDAVADDLTQDVFLKAFRNLDAFNGHSKFSTWLYRVALNTTRSWLKRQKRAPVACHSELPDPPAAAHRTPPQLTMDAELMVEVECALAALSPTLRAAIVLTALQGLEIREAAAVEGCTRATMYWRIHEARKQLLHRLDGYLSS